MTPKTNMNRCCETCLNSKGALSKSLQKKFGGICGTTCECHKLLNLPKEIVVSTQPTPTMDVGNKPCGNCHKDHEGRTYCQIDMDVEGILNEVSKAGVWVEGISSNGDTLLIKVKDLGKAFEYGIYDQKKLERILTQLITQETRKWNEKVDSLIDYIGNETMDLCENSDKFKQEILSRLQIINQ